MTMDYSGRDPNKSITDAEGVMFAANPIWDRTNRKRRGFGGGRRNAEPAAEAPTATVAAEPRSFAAEPDMILDRPVSRPMDRPSVTDTYVATPAATAAEAAYVAPATARADAEAAGMVAPIDRVHSTRAVKSNGVAPAAIAAGAVALVAVGAAGWWATRDTGGVPELTPGSTTSQVAAAPLAPAPIPEAPAAQAMTPPPPPAAAPTRMASAEPVRAERRAPAVRTRPATSSAPSAESAGTNASATMPAGPQPYSSLSTGSTATTPATTPILTLPPAQATPIPSTPPTAPEPTPTPATATPDPTPVPGTVTPPQ